MKPKLLGLLIVLGLQSLWILGTAAVHERALHAGTVVLLETRPVDPRDLLRGDYVILRYKISDLDPSLFQPALEGATPAAGTTVWVLLEPRGQFHEAVQASLATLKPVAGQVLMRGTVERPSAACPVRVLYGLEKYYVPEGTGNPAGKLTVQVAVPSSGQGQIKQMFVDGKPYADAMRTQRRPNR